jgi:hypothetical protein
MLEALGPIGRVLARMAWVKAQPDGVEELGQAWQRLYGRAPPAARPAFRVATKTGKCVLVFRVDGKVRIVVHTDAPNPWAHRSGWEIMDSEDSPPSIAGLFEQIGSGLSDALMGKR